MTIQTFFKKRPYLFWYIKKESLDQISEEAVVEAVLNYGDFEDVKKIIHILGMKKTARIYRRQRSRKRTNYDPKIAHYFDLYFKKYA